MDLLLTGRGVDGTEAERIGLVNRVTAPGEALSVALELARELAALPQQCMRNDRLSAIEQWDLDLDAATRNEARLGRATIDSGETVAGASRFAAGAGRHGTSGRLIRGGVTMTASTIADGEGQALRPALRGAIHRSSVPVAVCLTVLPRRPCTDAVALERRSIVYGACVVTMLTISGIYHLPSLFEPRAPAAAPARPRHDPRRHRRHVHGGDRARDVGGHASVMLVLVWTFAAVGHRAPDGVARRPDGPRCGRSTSPSAGSSSSTPSPSSGRSTASKWRCSSLAGCCTPLVP